MKEKLIPQRKRLAMGDSLAGYAKGGSVGVPAPTGSTDIVPRPTGKKLSPMTIARRNNGVKGI